MRLRHGLYLNQTSSLAPNCIKLLSSLQRKNDMYIYTVEAMRGQKAKSKDGTPIKYCIKRVNTEIPISKKGRSEFVRENLEYEEAMALANGFNDMEGKSQDKRDEVARQKELGS
jgi:hypothetical protein